MTAKGRSRGIVHIEDLPHKEFQNALEHISEYEITEKIDGAELLFGIDDKGFYTSREKYGGSRVYDVSEYGVTFPNSYKRAAHIALENVLTQMKSAGLKPGDQVEAEVLYGEVPNVVPYSPDTNYIVFLRTTEGTIDIDRLTQELDGHSLNVSIMTPFTEMGIEILYREEGARWKFSRTPKIPNTIPKFISKLRDPEKVKETILNKFVRKTTSPFGTKYGWIEGIVLYNPITGHRFKVIDKDVFLTEKNIQWQMRDSLMEYPNSPKYAKSLYGKLLVDMGDVLFHQELGTIMAKSCLRKMGNTTEERVAHLSKDMTYHYIRGCWEAILRRCEKSLGISLSLFEIDMQKVGHGMSESSIKKTRETFASFHEQIRKFNDGIAKAKTVEDLIRVFIGKQLNDLEKETI